MNFRQIHLDFHTSEKIEGIGKDFDKAQFQSMLKKGHVNSITVFSKCHHGWAYHPTEANEMHPYLDFDLLGAQIEAAHEIGVKTPVYISAGLDEKMVQHHHDWLIRDEHDRTNWVSDFMTPGYHQFCFNTPYLDYLLEQIKEVLQRYNADGLFLDIVGVRTCYCQHCMAKIRAQGKAPSDLDAMQQMWEETYLNYTKRVKEVVDQYKPGTPIFHNSGHIRRGRRDLAFANTHLELESLPTGGWGYQHFPLSARYVQALGLDFLGMTGKFHNTWGEFGGFKHPNALRYEAALSIANGAKCSIGDQLHPEGIMDSGTYDIIGQAYSEVEAKEAWCDGVSCVADIAMLSTEPILGNNDNRGGSSDNGCVKMLLEGKYLFDVIDLESDFTKYKVIILPDVLRLSAAQRSLFDAYIKGGGKILATGESSLLSDTDSFTFDFGASYVGKNIYSPSYFKPNFKPRSFEPTSFAIYGGGHELALAKGTELGEVQNPYFNREVENFCSHQHTPPTLKRFAPAMVEGNDGIYIAWDVFNQYSRMGSLILREMVIYSLDRLLGESKTLTTNLPAQGVVTLMDQVDESRYIQHNLYASPVLRGSFTGTSDNTKSLVEIIEDIIPIHGTKVCLKIDRPIKRVYLAPSMEEIAFTQEDGCVRYCIDSFECHQMVVLDY